LAVGCDAVISKAISETICKFESHDSPRDIRSARSKICPHENAPHFLRFLHRLTLLPLCAEEKSEAKADAKSDAKEVAVLKTSAGEMVVEFWPEVAPKTVENFKTLAKKGFYDGTAFHRVIKGFMIQGGDPLTKDPAKEAMWGTGDPGYKVKAEFNDRKHVRGVLSMARSQNPDSAGSQFFICHGDPSFLDGNTPPSAS
jgi:peptidyl-prolyl cis-trans isomerase B (cyclophilin B)